MYPADGGGDVACAAGPCVGVCPTPNENAPPVTWPSTAETVRQETVYTPVGNGPSGTINVSGWPGTSRTRPRSTDRPPASRTWTIENETSGRSVNDMVTASGAFLRGSSPAGGHPDDDADESDDDAGDPDRGRPRHTRRRCRIGGLRPGRDPGGELGHLGDGGILDRELDGRRGDHGIEGRLGRRERLVDGLTVDRADEAKRVRSRTGRNDRRFVLPGPPG